MAYTPDTKLLKYIKTCREKGAEDWQIRDALYSKGWEMKPVEEAFYYIRMKEEKKIQKEEKKAAKEKSLIKSPITIHLTNEILAAVEKRAKKNMLATEEQLADIIRRSTLTHKKQSASGYPAGIKDDIDDKFIGLFSRKTYGGRKKRDKSVSWA